MNVREALEKIRREWDPRECNDLLILLAPIIERALRAAYWEGETDCKHGRPGYSNRGVTAGVAVMVEKS